MSSHDRVPGLESQALHYTVTALDWRAHQFEVTLTLPATPARPVAGLPVWIPGSYLVREFARHVHGLQAWQGERALAVKALDKQSWQVDAAAGQTVQLRYRVYAFDASVRTAWLDRQRGFFNGAALCLYVQGQTERPIRLSLPRPQDAALAAWQAASTLRPLALDEAGFGDYQAQDYDELADAFVEMGAFWDGAFEARGVPHRIVVAGAPPSFDGPQLLADTQRICEAAIDFWGHAPHERYLFQLNAVAAGYGGLEHRHGTALMAGRRDLPQRAASTARRSEAYETLLGLISHEYFHTWNVKRLRPAEFARYRYERENYTDLLWFFEGFTSYYDDLLLCRAGLMDQGAYLRRVAKTINQVLQAPGARVQSVAQASFDAWTKYYRPDENTPNATITYYGKGALIALALDLSLRAEGRATLDDVMRGLWRRSGGGPIAEADIAAELQAHGGRSFAAELAAWVHGTDDLPLATLLAGQGVALTQEPAPLAQRLGLRVDERAGIVVLKNVLRHGAAEQAGLAAGDEWLGVEDAQGQGWRLNHLDDLRLYVPEPATVTALVARDGRLLRLPLTLPPPGEGVVQLALADAARAGDWLGTGVSAAA